MPAPRGSHARRSCDRCRSQKLRCERDAGTARCARCLRANTDCTLTARARQTRQGVFVFSKQCALIDRLVLEQPALDRAPAPDHTPFPGGLQSNDPAPPPPAPRFGSLYYRGSGVEERITWTVATHLTLSIDYSVEATADGREASPQVTLARTSQGAGAPSSRPMNRDLEANSSQSREHPAASRSFAACDP